MTDPMSLDIPVAGIQTGIPILPAALYDLQVASLNVEPNKDKTGRNLVIELTTTTPIDSMPDEKGQTRSINPGFPLKKYLALQAKSDSKDPEAYARQIAEVMDAVLQTDINTRPASLTREVAESMIGKIVRAKISVGDYNGAPSNSIDRLSKAV